MIQHGRSRKSDSHCDSQSPSQDLVIVGGGISGTSAAEVLALGIEQEQHDLATAKMPPMKARFRNISGVSILLGEGSLAFAPPVGEFAEFLTLAGTDTIRRDIKLSEQQNRVEGLFKSHGFDYKRNTIAKHISMTERGLFSIKAAQGDDVYSLESRKIILALGHSLRETPANLRSHIIRGTGELCRLLSKLHDATSSKQQTFDRFLSQFKPTPDGVIRIGLVGFGASCIEAIKIFYSLLAPPDADWPFFHTAGSGAPIHFTLIDSGLTRFFGSAPIDLMKYLQVCHEKIEGSDEPGSLLTKRDEEFHKQAARMRIARLLSSEQLKAIGSRLNWHEVVLHDGLLETPMIEGGRQPFSCMIDCSPFITGIGRKHRDLLANLPMLKINPLSEEGWHVNLCNESDKSTIGLVGAAFHKPQEWDASTFFRQSIKTVSDLFPPESQE